MLDSSPACVRSCKQRRARFALILRITVALALGTCANAAMVTDGYIELDASIGGAESAWNTGGKGALGEGEGEPPWKRRICCHTATGRLPNASFSARIFLSG